MIVNVFKDLGMGLQFFYLRSALIDLNEYPTEQTISLVLQHQIRETEQHSVSKTIYFQFIHMDSINLSKSKINFLPFTP